MFTLILQIFYFFLPIGFANSAPVFVKKIKYFNFLDIPCDFNKTFNNKPILGRSKTFRGLISATIMGITVCCLQKYLFNKGILTNFSIIDYSRYSAIFLGFLLGFGAIFGDMVESFFKRQFNVKSGDPFLIFDQIDYILGAIAFSVFYFSLGIKNYILAIIIYVVMHFLVSYLGYLTGFKDKPV